MLHARVRWHAPPRKNVDKILKARFGNAALVLVNVIENAHRRVSYKTAFRKAMQFAKASGGAVTLRLAPSTVGACPVRKLLFKSTPYSSTY